MFLYDKIIVVDVEATCWEENLKPQDMCNDIIEIGICKYVIATGEIEDKRSYFIKPQRSTISLFCSNLTGITQEKIDKESMSFEEACKKIRKRYGSNMRAWAAYGEYDRTIIQNHCKDFNVDNPFSETYINIKTMFIFKNKMPNALSLLEELEIIGEKFKGTIHNGADDAYNAAKLLKNILN
nr:3'-5' exonuclease [uncultured Flavobacterium sp.]